MHELGCAPPIKISSPRLKLYVKDLLLTPTVWAVGGGKGGREGDKLHTFFLSSMTCWTLSSTNFLSA